MKLKMVPFLVLVLVFHTGAIRKERNIITETQTDPISLKKKLEELKDGEKGPTTFSYEFYEGRNFQTQAPVDQKPETGRDSGAQDMIPQYGEPIPENLEGLDQEKKPEDDWWTESWGSESEPKKETKNTQWEEKW